MGGSVNKQVRLHAVPSGPLQVDDFEVATAPVPSPGPGEVLCRTVALTIGAGQRAGLQGSASYAGAPQAGVVMSGTVVAQVLESRSGEIPAGSVVVAPSGWQEYSVHPAQRVELTDVTEDPLVRLGPLGNNGLAAYFGIIAVGTATEYETLLVSAAAGSVGHLAGQIGRALKCHVVGVAGSQEKCELLTSEIGFDRVIDRRQPDFRAHLKEATPNRVDVYFDNTGGPVLEGALSRMNIRGRIVCCGVASQYDTANPSSGPRGVPGLLVNNRVRMEGFLVFDFADQYAVARDQIRRWISNGTIKPLCTTYEGLESAPRAFVDLLAGRTVGTTGVIVAG